MRIRHLLLPALVLLAPTLARAQEVMGAVRAGQWAQADAAAAQYADPVAGKLVGWMRMQTPGAASATEITAFLVTNPDWPAHAALLRRRDEALATDPDDAAVLAICDKGHPALSTALARCADALRVAGRTADAGNAARAAWLAAPPDPAWETKFLAKWGRDIGREDQLRRFNRLAWTDTAGAQRQLQRVNGLDRAVGEVRLAFRRDDPNAPNLLNALPAAQKADPILFLEQARWLRRAGKEDEAMALWQAGGQTAERAAPADRQAAFWEERNLLARRRLRAGDGAGAYAIASGHAQTSGEAFLDAEFLSGFIALRRLADGPMAAKHFRALIAASKSVITQARGHYWLARALGDGPAAAAEYRAAAAWPSAFYGQLAAIALGDAPKALAQRITAQADPATDAARALDVAGRDLARAAALLVGWNEPRRAAPFFLRLDELMPDTADRVTAAKLALGFGLPDVAVALARRAGRDGVMMIQTGWPLAADIPPDAGVEPALVLGLVRQESSFDAGAVSPVGARGLMQLMPATAAATARKLNLAAPPTALTDPALNLRLGTAYLRDLLDQFTASVPLAISAYNAGPSRVGEWLMTNGDPRAGAIDIIDWIELIPFNETRNYAQRVIENQVIYRAQRGDALAHPLAQWLR